MTLTLRRGHSDLSHTAGTTEPKGLQWVIPAGRGHIADKVIRGDLAGSRVVLSFDVVPLTRWPVVHDGLVDGSVEVG
jgi:hypothetical protein